MRGILAAHGAGDDSVANDAVRTLATNLKRRDPDLRIEPAFNRGSPSFSESSKSADAQVLVIPLMTSDGYFVKRIARAFGAKGASVTPPIGLLPALRAAILERARDLCSSRSGDTVLIVGHGTPRHRASANSTDALAAELRQRIENQVRTAYLDQEPTFEDVLAELEGKDLIVVPFLWGGGVHEREDIPGRIQSHHHGRAEFVAPLISDPRLEDWLNELIEISRRRLPLAIGTRGSRLALWQAKHVAEKLGAAGVPTRIVIIETQGDREKDRSLESFESDGPFTDAIEHALDVKEIDLAVHSLKDLPLREEPLSNIAAVIERGSAEEALVSREGRTLLDLPFGATVGTSSPRRAWQVKKMRPDLVPIPIRGNVEHRVEQVLAGRFDSAILAEAGLERLNLASVAVQRWPVDAFVPQAGQGAIAVQTRPDDWFARSLCSRIDHHETRQAVQAELIFAREIEGDGRIAAAHATFDGENVRLRARVIDRFQGEMRDFTAYGRDAGDVGREAAQQLRRGVGEARCTVG